MCVTRKNGIIAMLPEFIRLNKLLLMLYLRLIQGKIYHTFFLLSLLPEKTSLSMFPTLFKISQPVWAKNLPLME